MVGLPTKQRLHWGQMPVVLLQITFYNESIKDQTITHCDNHRTYDLDEHGRMTVRAKPSYAGTVNVSLSVLVLQTSFK